MPTAHFWYLPDGKIEIVQLLPRDEHHVRPHGPDWAVPLVGLVGWRTLAVADRSVVTGASARGDSATAPGGFWVIDAPDLDVALKLAAEGSKACRGKVEVRPFDGLA